MDQTGTTCQTHACNVHAFLLNKSCVVKKKKRISNELERERELIYFFKKLIGIEKHIDPFLGV